MQRFPIGLCLFFATWAAGAVTPDLLTKAVGAPVKTSIETVLGGLSGNGRWVAFLSKSTDLATNKHNPAVYDVFAQDLQNGQTRLVSVSADGTEGANAGCNEVSISADGRWVVFTSAASNLTTNDTNGRPDVFARDMAAGVTTLVSAKADGSAATGTAGSPWLTASGKYVAFVSDADLGVGVTDTNGFADVFLHDLETRETKAVTVDRSNQTTPYPGIQSGLSFLPAQPPRIAGVSEDGRRVGYLSGSGQLNLQGLNLGSAALRAYVRDMIELTNILASTFDGSSDYKNPSPIRQALLSGDGSVMCFAYESDMLYAGWRDLSQSTGVAMRLVGGITPGGGIPPYSAESLQMNSNGRLVYAKIFRSGQRRDYLWESENQTTNYFSNIVFSASVQFHLFGETLIRAGLGLTNGTTTALLLGTNAITVRDVAATGDVAASDDGAVLAYDSMRDGVGEVRVATAEGDRPLLDLNVSMAGSGSDTPVLTRPLAVSADGRRILFSSGASNLGSGDAHGWPQLYVHDRQSHSNILITAGLDGLPALSIHDEGCLSANGGFVLFISTATNLVENDTNGWPDVFVRDVELGATVRLTGRVAPAAGKVFPASRTGLYLSPDGRYAGFSSKLHDLFENSLGNVSGLYVVDLETDTVWLAGTNSIGSSWAKVLSIAPGPVVTETIKSAQRPRHCRLCATISRKMSSHNGFPLEIREWPARMAAQWRGVGP